MLVHASLISSAPSKTELVQAPLTFLAIGFRPQAAFHWGPPRTACLRTPAMFAPAEHKLPQAHGVSQAATPLGT
jgi:hypothetical protein